MSNKEKSQIKATEYYFEIKFGVFSLYLLLLGRILRIASAIIIELYGRYIVIILIACSIEPYVIIQLRYILYTTRLYPSHIYMHASIVVDFYLRLTS